MLTPSMNTAPSKKETIRQRIWMILDFPDPVLPTIPIFSPGLVSKLTFFRAYGHDDLYFKLTLTNVITPCDGHAKGG